jgi:hypothetical protein
MRRSIDFRRAKIKTRIEEMTRTTMEKWDATRKSKPHEVPAVFGIDMIGKDWLIVMKLPSGRLFTGDTREFHALYDLLIHCGEKSGDWRDQEAIMDFSEQMAMKFEDDETLEVIHRARSGFSLN